MRALFNAPITAVLTLHRSHVVYLAGVTHPARHRCCLIRHLILPPKPPDSIAAVQDYAAACCCPSRSMAEVGCVDFKYLFLSLFDYCLSLSSHSLITHLALFTCVFTLSDTHCSCCQLTQTLFATHPRHSLLLHTNHHGYQLGSSSWSHHFRPGMLDCRCFPSCLLLQPLHSPGRGGRRAQRETSVSSSPSNSAHCS